MIKGMLELCHNYAIDTKLNLLHKQNIFNIRASDSKNNVHIITVKLNHHLITW